MEQSFLFVAVGFPHSLPLPSDPASFPPEDADWSGPNI